MGAEAKNCTICNRPIDPAWCRGIGYRFIEEGVGETCPNKIAAQFRRRLGAEFDNVPAISSSPLYETNASRVPTADLTKDNLAIYSTWTGLLPHLKRCLVNKGLDFFFRIITDERIKNVFVGAESYKSRSESAQEDTIAYNALPDLVRDPALLIIKLGYLGYKNISAAGALKEALLIRESASKPTWVVIDNIDANHRWTFSHNAEVQYYIDTKFKQLTLETGENTARWNPATEDIGMSRDDDDDLALLQPPDTQGELIVEDCAPVSTDFDFDRNFPGGTAKRKWR